MLPQDASVLDVGSGDGTIANIWKQKRADLKVEGIDVFVRPTTLIPVRKFDGKTIPFEDKSVDVVSFVDVLHHADNAIQLLQEASRVAKSLVLIKDHLSENRFDHFTLAAMDWVGNAPYGVSLLYNYWSRRQWEHAYNSAGLTEIKMQTKVPLYAFPLSLAFGRGLHFISLLKPAR